MIFASDLNIFWDDNASFVDISKELIEYGRDTKVLPLVATEDYIYVGLYKPFTKLYAEMKVVNAVTQTFTAQYYNGSTWNSLENFYDQSLGWTRSGFMSWSNSEDWAATTINNTELFWIRFKPSANLTGATELQGLNIVYSDDVALAGEFSRIADYLNGLTSYVTYHEAVRDDIVQAIRNSGKKKHNTTTYNNITKWDLLDIDEVKKGATYHCLAKIFFELSDATDDKWFQMSKEYTAKGNKALELFFLSLDVDDDGIEDSNEKVQSQPVSLVRY